MIEKVHEKIDVVSISRQNRGIVEPIRIQWKNKVYNIRKIGLAHPIHEGRTLCHIFEGTDGTTFFRLKHNTSTLQWFLEEINDGLPS